MIDLEDAGQPRFPQQNLHFLLKNTKLIDIHIHTRILNGFHIFMHDTFTNHIDTIPNEQQG